jgi:hypothetical protein
VNDTESAEIDRTVRPIDASTAVSSRHIMCKVCRGCVDDRWYPRCHTRSYEVQKTEASKTNKSPADNGEWSELSTVEVEVVTARDDPMTPIPSHNSDDNSDSTESEEDKVIYSTCYQCNDKVPIQMKKNGTCHGRCFYCHRNKRHLV